MSESKPIEGYLDSMPEPAAIRQQIAENIRDRQILRQLLKIAEQHRKADEASSCK